MVIHHKNREFILNARHDGDFWLVEVFEIAAGKQRLRFEYKLNTPRDGAAGATEGVGAFFDAKPRGSVTQNRLTRSRGPLPPGPPQKRRAGRRKTGDGR